MYWVTKRLKQRKLKTQELLLMKNLRWIYCTFIHFKSLWKKKEIFLINYELETDETLSGLMNLIQKDPQKVRIEFLWFCFCLPLSVRFQTCYFSFSFHSNKNLNREVCSLKLGAFFLNLCNLCKCWQIVYLGFSLHISSSPNMSSWRPYIKIWNTNTELDIVG